MGREEGGSAGQDATITFGPEATFGSLPSVNGNQLKITTVSGQTYIASTPLSLLHNGASEHDGIAIPQKAADSGQVGGQPPIVAAGAAVSASASAPTVDVLVAYTSGYRAYRGGTSATVTYIVYLISVANHALSNSQVQAQYRLVDTMEVNYPDIGDNSAALTDLQSSAATSPLAAVHAARDQYGADLVSLMRVYGSTQGSCGVGYIMQSDHDPNYAFAEFSDGQYDELNGYYSYCTTLTLAHEMGHNLGAAHNQQIAPTGGLFPYSYGYRDDAANFYDIMAYGLSGQQQFEIYSTPLITNCNGVPCGTSATADVSRTLRQTMPIAANFRATAVVSADAAIHGPITLVGSGRCLDVVNGGTTNGSPLQMWDCNGLNQQYWYIQDNAGTLNNPGVTPVLDVVGLQTTDGTRLQIWSPTQAPNQSWYFNNAELVTTNGRVLDAVNYGVENGTRLQVWDATGAFNQHWRVDPVTNQITNSAGRCLDILNYGTADNTPVQIYDCTGVYNQKWYLQSNGMIVSGTTGLCLQLTGTATGNGTQVSVATCNGSPQQAWRVRGELRSKQSDKCLDDPAGGSANGSAVQIYTCLGNGHQRWEY